MTWHLEARAANGARLESGNNPSPAARTVFERLRARGYAVALVAAAPAMASPAVLPLSVADPAQPSHASMQDAMREAAQAALAVSTKSEVGGALFSQNGAFYFTLGVTQGDPLAVDYRVAIPKGATLVALYHTHPGPPHPGSGASPVKFSAADIFLARQVNLPMYVVSIEARQVLGYRVAGFSL